jgi:hypothetical protein
MVRDGCVQFRLPAGEAEITLASERTGGGGYSNLECRRLL